MKHSLRILFTIAILFFAAENSQAGFTIKRRAAVTTAANSVATSKNANAIPARKEHQSKFMNTIQQLSRPLFGYRQRPSEWIGIAALFSGILGLFVPGINLLAILFGVLGMGRNCRTSGLAVAGFVMGVLELLLYLFFGTMFLSLILL